MARTNVSAMTNLLCQLRRKTGTLYRTQLKKQSVMQKLKVTVANGLEQVVCWLTGVGDANGASRYPRYQPPMLAATTGIVHSSTDPVHPSVAHSGAGHADTYHMSARGDSIH